MDRVIKAAHFIEALMPPEARAPADKKYVAEKIAIAAFNNLDVAFKERAA